MKHRVHRELDIYTELFPASCATIIGAGVVTCTMGAAPVMGVAIVLTGVAVGVAGPIAKTIHEHRTGRLN